MDMTQNDILISSLEASHVAKRLLLEQVSVEEILLTAYLSALLLY